MLTYHRVIPRGCRDGGERPSNTLFEDEFDQQMAWVADRYNVTTGNELRGFLEGSATLPRNALALTFDDGYENNFSYVLPILQRYRLHAIFFLTTNLIGHDHAVLWFDRLEHLLNATSTAKVAETMHDLDSSISGRSRSHIFQYFKRMPHGRQFALLTVLEGQLLPSDIPPPYPIVNGLMS